MCLRVLGSKNALKNNPKGNLDPRLVFDAVFHGFGLPFSSILASKSIQQTYRNPTDFQSPEMGSQGDPGPPFWASWGPVWPHSAPRVEFWTISELICGVILSQKSMKFGVDFRSGFGMLFWKVLEWFWDCFGWLCDAQMKTERKRAIYEKPMFYLRKGAVFEGSGLQKCSRKRSKKRPRSKGSFRCGFSWIWISF